MRFARTRAAFRRVAVGIGGLVAAIGIAVGAEQLRPAMPSSPITIPFDFDHGVILVDIMLNGGGPYRFLVDTGTDPSVVDSGVADSASWFQLPLGNQGSGAGSSRVGVALPPPIRVGLPGLRGRHLLALSTDLSAAATRLGEPLHGVLGHNFLRRYRLEIDYTARHLRFLPPGEAWSVPGHATVADDTLEFLPGGGFPLLAQVSVNGVELRATLDTGSNQGVTLFAAGVKRLGLEEAVREADVGTVAGFGGEVQVRSGFVTSVNVGPLRVDSVSASFVMSGPRASTPLDVRGVNIGNGVLSQFVVGLNYPGARTVLYQPD